VESLEGRVVPYATTGTAWPHPQLVTISFVPDGTLVGDLNGTNVYSNLFATLGARYTTSQWQGAILRAAQVWAQQTNLNLQVVSDNGAESGSGNYQQGDPGMGDIRVGGYNFGDSNVLAEAFEPPSGNNYSIAGDINFNTGQPFNIGATYDLFTVAAHEFGHAFGLDHSSYSAADLYANYNNVKSSLTGDDTNGIRSIYSNGSPRSQDQYDAGSTPNTSFAAAANLTSQINTKSLTALVTNLDVTTAGQADYYTFTAPAGTNGTLTVNVQTAGLSLLRQSVTLYAANQTTVLASGSSAGALNGTTVSLKVTGVTAGQVFYLKVTGADTTAFGTGAYALTLNFGAGANPTVPRPNTQTAEGNPLTGGGGLPETTTTSPGIIGSVLNLVDGVLGIVVNGLTGPLAVDFLTVENSGPSGSGPGNGGSPGHDGSGGAAALAAPAPPPAAAPAAAVPPPALGVVAAPLVPAAIGQLAVAAPLPPAFGTAGVPSVLVGTGSVSPVRAALPGAASQTQVLAEPALPTRPASRGGDGGGGSAVPAAADMAPDRSAEDQPPAPAPVSPGSPQESPDEVSPPAAPAADAFWVAEAEGHGVLTAAEDADVGGSSAAAAALAALLAWGTLPEEVEKPCPDAR
jgi:hypothetical protein